MIRLLESDYKVYFDLRRLMAGRLFRHLGIIVSAFLAVLAVLLLYLFSKMESHVVSAAFFCLLIPFHFGRNDLEFLFLLFGKKYRNCLMLEYAVYAVPFFDGGHH